MKRVYQLDKAKGIVGGRTPESRQFAAGRLAAGASELRDLIDTAWVESARPVADPYAPKKEGAAAKP